MYNDIIMIIKIVVNYSQNENKNLKVFAKI